MRLDPYPVALPPSELEAFEAEFGFRLPDDYRAFLLSHNGGVLRREDEDEIAGFPARAEPPLDPEGQERIAPGGFWDVQMLFGLLRPPGRYGDLREIYPTTRDWDHPDELLPIACQSSNVKYFLCAAGPRTGQILLAADRYLDRRADGETITPDDYHRLCGSFAEMRDGLEWRRD